MYIITLLVVLHLSKELVENKWFYQLRKYNLHLFYVPYLFGMLAINRLFSFFFAADMEAAGLLKREESH